MWEIEQLKIKKKKKLLAKIEIQNFEFGALHTKTFNINWIFLAKTFLHLIINILQYRSCYLVTLGQSYRIFYKI